DIASVRVLYWLGAVVSSGPRRHIVHSSPDYAGLSARIRLIEEPSDVAPYYRAADLYVHPTLNDSIGMAPLEAMSFGLPVILSPAPWCGFAQYVQDGREVALLDHPENDGQLAELIQRTSDDEPWRQQLVHGASQVVDRHAWSEMAKSYLALYAQVLRER